MEPFFYHISTDEVYGSLNKSGFFSENSNYKPNSPYSASKASSNHFVRSLVKLIIFHMLFQIRQIIMDHFNTPKSLFP